MNLVYIDTRVTTLIFWGDLETFPPLLSTRAEILKRSVMGVIKPTRAKGGDKVRSHVFIYRPSTLLVSLGLLRERLRHVKRYMGFGARLWPAEEICLTCL